MRSLLERVLRSQGHTVITAASGPEALALLSKHPIDLVILDVMMPEMSGIEVLEHMKANPPHTKYRFWLFQLIPTPTRWWPVST